MKTTLFAGAGFSIAVWKAVDNMLKKIGVGLSGDPMPSAYQMFNNGSARDYLHKQYSRLRLYLEKYYGDTYKNGSYEEMFTDILSKIPYNFSGEKARYKYDDFGLPSEDDALAIVLWFEYCYKKRGDSNGSNATIKSIVNKYVPSIKIDDGNWIDNAKHALEFLFPLTWEHVDAVISLKEMVHEHMFVNLVPHKDEATTKVMIDVIRGWLKFNNISNIITTNPDIVLDIAVMGATEFNDEFVKKMNLNKDWYVELTTDELGNPPRLPILSITHGKGVMSEIENFIKIHGSISMLRKNSLEKEKKYYWLKKYIWSSGISSGYLEYDGKYIREPIPPISGKKINLKVLFEDEPYKSLYANAENILKNTEKIIFYGYGFSEHDKAVNAEIKKYITNVKDISVIDTRCKEYEFKNVVAEVLDKKIGEIKFLDHIEYGIQ